MMTFVFAAYYNVIINAIFCMINSYVKYATTMSYVRFFINDPQLNGLLTICHIVINDPQVNSLLNGPQRQLLINITEWFIDTFSHNKS